MEDDDDSWVPLELPVEAPAQHPQRSVAEVPAMDDQQTSSSPAVATASSASLQIAKRRRQPQARSDNTGENSVQALQRRVEMRQHLQQRLVHHPIRLLWSHFLWHMLQEFWHLDLQVRVALVLIVLGFIAKATCWMTWYLWYPRTIFMSFLLLGSWLYLDPNGIPRRVQNFFQTLVELPNRIPETLEQLDAQQARVICMAFLSLPTLLQVRTISFLADTNATGGGWRWNGFVTLVLLGVCAFHLAVPRHIKAARDISQMCLLVLYGSALWIALYQCNLLTLPSLVAPFFLSTGTLLLSYDDHDNMEWFSRMIRQALRLTLRDVLTTVGTSVQEDEMLQLAMLRWIVDYWSYTPPSSSSSSSSSSRTTTQRPISESSQQGASSSTAPSTAALSTSNTQELGWDELMPMLNVATDQMTREVHSLQQPQQTSASSSTSSSTTPADHSLHNFQSMLASMNVDDRAQPAVAAYRRNVEDFPPSRRLALVVSIMRRCPACLVFLWQLLVASMFQTYSTTFCIFVLLVPLIGLEVLRIQSWIRACESLSRVLEATAETPSEAQAKMPQQEEEPVTSANDAFSTLLQNVDPMTILLSGDDDTILTCVTSQSGEGATRVTTQVSVPTLLIVWRNIQSSVGALEVSLTAARCVHTGAVAVDFAKNIMSLAKFGVEVSEHGWMHGLTVIFKEVIFQQDGDVNARDRSITHAAVSAVHNGTRVAHNLRVLAVEDNNTGRVLAPLVGFFGFLGGLLRPNNEGEQNAAQRNDSEGNQEGDSSMDASGSCNKSSSVADEAKTSDSEKMGKEPVVNEMDESDEVVASHFVNARAATNEDGFTGEENAWKAIKCVSTQPKDSSISAVEGAVTWRATQEPKPTAYDDADFEPLVGQEPLFVHGVENSDNDNHGGSKTKGKRADTGSAEIEKLQSVVKHDTTNVGTNAGSKLEDTKTDEKEETSGASEDLAAVMEMIAEAFEAGLIDESEKNAFCLKLTENTDSGIILGMKKTLQGLLESSCVQTNDGARPADGLVGKELTCGADVDNKESPNNDAWSPVVQSVASQEEIAIQSFDYSDRLANAVNSDEASLSMPRLSESEGIAETDGGGIPTVSSSAPSDNRRNNEEDNMWVKVGGSMAVLGAVVGGAFLAMNQGNENARQDENRGNRTSVRIERLDEEEEDRSQREAAGYASASTQAQ